MRKLVPACTGSCRLPSPAVRALLLGLLLSVCLPSAAQNAFLSSNTVAPATPAPSSRFGTGVALVAARASTSRERAPSGNSGDIRGRTSLFSPGVPVHPRPDLRFRFGPAAELPGLDPSAQAFVSPLSRYAHFNHNATLESSVDTVDTPFAERVRMPVAVLGGGRMKLGGFYSYGQTENVLLGLPGSGALPAWSASRQNHPGVLVPFADESYGLSLTLGLRRDSDPDHRPQLLRCLGWVMHVRGCHLMN